MGSVSVGLVSFGHFLWHHVGEHRRERRRRHRAAALIVAVVAARSSCRSPPSLPQLLGPKFGDFTPSS
ncbi:MAG: hypothetical protein U0Q22_17065 [Acidimicrobiales bacterium]